MSYIIHLRPHHALCTQFFKGHGYSDKFVENMTAVLNLLNNDNPKVRFVEHCDDICACCPKNTDGKCKNESSVMQTDKECLAEYGFSIGEELHWKDIKSDVVNKIISQQKLPSVCTECHWLSVCEKIKFEEL